MQIEDFREAFVVAAGRASGHIKNVMREDGRLSGVEMAVVMAAAQEAGFSRPTPELIAAIAKYQYVSGKERLQIVLDAQQAFYGRSLIEQTLREQLSRPGEIPAIVHIALRKFAERIPAYIAQFFVHLCYGVGFR